MNLYVSLRNSSHGLLSANNVLFLESVQLINLTHDSFLFVIFFGSFVERKVVLFQESFWEGILFLKN